MGYWLDVLGGKTEELEREPGFYSSFLFLFPFIMNGRIHPVLFPAIIPYYCFIVCILMSLNYGCGICMWFAWNTMAGVWHSPQRLSIPWNYAASLRPTGGCFHLLGSRVLFKTQNMPILPLSWETDLTLLIIKKDVYIPQKEKRIQHKALKTHQVCRSLGRRVLT